MKRALSFLTSALMLASVPCFSAAAQNNDDTGLPFELSAPENVSILYMNGDDSDNTCEIHYSQNNSMSEWSSKVADPDTFDSTRETLAELGDDDLGITAQIDWSIDSEDDWHYNEDWETEGYDADYHQHLGEWAFISCAYSNETAMSEWIFRGMGNIDDPEDRTWYGRHEDSDDFDGWKDVLKEDQYEVVKGDGESHAKIDFTKHTIYTRVRWLVTCRPLDGEDMHIASDWSEVAAVGKDAEAAEALKPGDIQPPVISDLKYTDEDFNGFPVISFKLDISDEFSAQIAQAAGTQGVIWLEVEARLQGKEDWVGLQGDFTLKSGEMKIALQALAEAEGEIAKDTPIELRARYYCSQADQEDFYSDYSETLTFGSVDMAVEKEEEISEAEESAESEAPASSTESSEKETEEEESSFPWWIIILIIILLIIIIVIIILVLKKKKEENKA